MNHDPNHDQALFQALQRGEDTALNHLIGRWERPLFAFAWRYTRNTADAQDLVSETFVRLYQQRERLREDTRLSAWLFTTLTNLCHNQHRWRRRHPTVSFDAPHGEAPGLCDTLPSESEVPLARMEQDERLSSLGDALNRLPHDLKTTLLLHYYERLSYREIGEITGCSERGVETRLYRARQRLRDELGAQLETVT